MAVTLKQVETIPAYPDAPGGLSEAAAAIDPGAIWSRIEAYICHRFTVRPVVWTVEGPGDWEPPLTPATVSAVEVWAGEEWSEVFPSPSPLGGFVLAACGPYRVTASAGSATVPADVAEAYRRLAEYLGASVAPAGATSYALDLGQIKESVSLNASHAARALINSGAADLLRPYRRAS